MSQPAEISWGPEGVSGISHESHDGYAEHFVKQAPLRALVQRVTSPQITVQQLARATGITEATLYHFMRGRSLQPDNADALAQRLMELLP